MPIKRRERPNVPGASYFGRSADDGLKLGGGLRLLPGTFEEQSYAFAATGSAEFPMLAPSGGKQPPLKAAIIPVTPLQQNCTLFWCTETNKAALVDPGGDRDTPYVLLRFGADGALLPGAGPPRDLSPAQLHHLLTDTITA